MKLWKPDAPHGEKSCCGVDAVNDARRVAQILDIPYYALDMAEEFEDTVIKNFVSEYQAGRTPNPCITCNIDMKFGKLLAKAHAIGAERVATGHYAKLRHDTNNDRYIISRADDHSKDQSYTMWGLSQSQLAKMLLPLGAYSKHQIRELAKKIGLPTADKKDSQEICFVATDYRDFLKGRNIETKPGNFVDPDGRVLGQHDGHLNFTVGQRKGTRLALGEPAYVIAKDAINNLVTLGNKAQTHKTEFRLRNVNWQSIVPPKDFLEAHIKARYNDALHPVKVFAMDDGLALIRAEQPIWAITPGQSAVFYDDHGDVLGGGYIV